MEPVKKPYQRNYPTQTLTLELHQAERPTYGGLGPYWAAEPSRPVTLHISGHFAIKLFVVTEVITSDRALLPVPVAYLPSVRRIIAKKLEEMVGRPVSLELKVLGWEPEERREPWKPKPMQPLPTTTQVCTKCTGTVITTEDQYGRYGSCLRCGAHYK